MTVASKPGWRDSRAAPIIGLMLAIVILILPDMGTMVGTDFSYYLDLAAYIHRGGHLFRDYSDYRLPVFPLIISPLVGLMQNDVALRLSVMFAVYLFYGIALYAAALAALKVSRMVALSAALIAVVTVAARNFDPGRNEIMPLFHETMVFIALSLIVRVMDAGAGESFTRKAGLAVAAGAACAAGFLGRQVGVLPGLVMIVLLAARLGGIIKAPEQRRAILALWAGFPPGFGAVAAVIVAILAWHNPDFFSSIVTWVFVYPSQVYGAPGLLPRLAAPFSNAMEFYALSPWVLWPAIVAIVARMVLQAKGLADRWPRRQFVLPALMAVQYALVPFLIGRSMGIYQLPAVTFFALLLALAVDGVAWPQFWRTALVPALLVSPFWLTQAIVEAKGVHWGWKGIRNPQATFTNRLAGTVRAAMAQSGPHVLNLGGFSSVGRLTGYQPFMGLTLDCLLYEAPLFLPPARLEQIERHLDQLDVMYGFKDIACYSHATASPALKAYFSRNFRVFAYVAPDLSYPYNYSQPMAVYVRKGATRESGGLGRHTDR